MRGLYGFKPLLAALLLGFLLFCPQAGAVALNLELDTTEYLNELVFYPDGTYDCGKVTGYLSVTNPSLNDTVSDININFSDGIIPPSMHINELGPNSTATITYELSGSDSIFLPSVYEAVEPSSLYQGVGQEVVFRVDVGNNGSEDICILAFEKEFPEELEFVNYTLSAGSITRTGNSFCWENFTVFPASNESLLVIFKTTPSSDIVLPPSEFSFTTPAFAASKSLSLSAVTSTRFAVEKQKVGEGVWNVGVVVEDAGEFNCSLYEVKVYVSDTSLKETELIRDYALDLSLGPGESWRDSFVYEYPQTPVFFAKVYYTIPYTLSGSSMPLSPSGSGGFVINSIVSGDRKSHHHDNDEADDDNQQPEIIKLIYPAHDNGSVSESSPQTNEEETPEVQLPYKNWGRYFNIFLLLLLPGLLGLAGRKLLPFFPFFPFFRKEQIAISSSSLEEIFNAGAQDLLFSRGRKAVISGSEFAKLNLGNTGSEETPDEHVEKGRIKVIDDESGAVHEIMGKYTLSPEEASVLAVAASSGAKSVLTMTPEGRFAAEEMGFRVVELLDILPARKPVTPRKQ